MFNLEKPDALIVGCGPSGMAAAIELAKDPKKQILLVDRDDQAGGLPRFCDHPGFGIEYSKRLHSGPAFVSYMLKKIAKFSNIKLLTRTTVTQLVSGPSAVLVSTEFGVINCNPKSILVATGVREATRASRMICGHRPNNSMINTGQLQQINHRNITSMKGRKAVILGTELVSFSALLSARQAGIKIIAFVEAEQNLQSFNIIKPVVEKILRVPIYTNTQVEFVKGDSNNIEAVQVITNGESHTIPCDMLILTGDWQGDSYISEQSGIKVDNATRAISTDQSLETNIAGIFATGNVTHPVETSGSCANEGKQAGVILNDFLSGKLAGKKQSISIEAGHNILLATPQKLHFSDIAELPQTILIRTEKSFTNVMVIFSQGDKELYRHKVKSLRAFTGKKIPLTDIKTQLNPTLALSIRLEA